jgi:hypothetical protein
MRGRERAGAAGEFLWENADAILVMAVAAIVLVLHVLDRVDAETVGSATLAMLGVTAFVLIRDRKSRAALDDLRQIAADAQSELPYDIVWQRNEWDIKDRKHATIRMTQRLRFTRNEVFTLPHRSSGDGKITRCDAMWRRPSEDEWIEARKVDELETATGDRLLFSLGEEQSRGDMIDWRVEREAVDRFSAPQEAVKHLAKSDSEFPRRVRIIWPRGQNPHHIEMRLGNHPAQRLRSRKKKGRHFIDETVQALHKGDSFDVSWKW